MNVTDATKHYLTDEHQSRNLKEIRCVVLGSYFPSHDADDAMSFSFLVGERGNIIQTLPLNRYVRSPGSILVGVFGKTEPMPAQLSGVANLCTMLHSRAPRILRLGGFSWSRETFAKLNVGVHELLEATEPRPMAAFGIRVL